MPMPWEVPSTYPQNMESHVGEWTDDVHIQGDLGASHDGISVFYI